MRHKSQQRVNADWDLLFRIDTNNVPVCVTVVREAVDQLSVVVAPVKHLQEGGSSPACSCMLAAIRASEAVFTS